MFVNTNFGQGRLGNKFIGNMTVYLLSNKHNTLCDFNHDDKLNKIGINFESVLVSTLHPHPNFSLNSTPHLTISKNKIFSSHAPVSTPYPPKEKASRGISVLNSAPQRTKQPTLKKNFNHIKPRQLNKIQIVSDLEVYKYFSIPTIKLDKDTEYTFIRYCQDPKSVIYIVEYFKNINNPFCKSIIEKNKFKDRYKTNNDIFIHIRAGDVFSIKKHPMFPTISFYNNTIENIKKNEGYDNIYLCSDNIKADICQELIKKYNIQVKEYDEVDTIHFGSTCKNVIISSGSFSFMIGLFSFYSKVYYEKDAGKGWHPTYYDTLKK